MQKINQEVLILNEKQKQIDEIVSFVAKHRNSHASHTVCLRILGDDYLGVDRETINALREKLPDVEEDEFEACYYIIK